MKTQRNVFDKLNTLLFGKDLRVTEGEVYTDEREGDYSSYLPIDKYISAENAPEKVLDIRSFGADISRSDNADAINKAIDEGSKNGGTVLVSGGRYFCSTVFLKSNVTLFVEKNSCLEAVKSGKGFSENAFIFADKCENIEITGGGKFVGNGHLFGFKPIKDNCFEAQQVIDVISMRQEYRARLRFSHPSKYGNLCLIRDSKNINIHNCIFEDSAYWTLKLLNCEDVAISDFVINNNRHVANSDGIDITSSSNVNVSHCFISTADDGIVLKNASWLKSTGEMHSVFVRDCEVISATNAFKIGTETTFPIKNITVENCRFFMTDLYPGSVSGISIESSDGSVVSDITIRNIEMNRCTCPLFIRLNDRNRASQVTEVTAHATELKVNSASAVSKTEDKNRFDFKGEIKNILIENIKAQNIEIPVIIAGCRQKGKTQYIENVTLNNFDLSYRDAVEIKDNRLFIPEYAKEYPESWRFRNLPAYALWARHAKNIQVENFSCVPVKNHHREEMILKDVKNFERRD